MRGLAGSSRTLARAGKGYETEKAGDTQAADYKPVAMWHPLALRHRKVKFGFAQEKIP
jgi:hypothetical protein